MSSKKCSLAAKLKSNNRTQRIFRAYGNQDSSRPGVFDREGSGNISTCTSESELKKKNLVFVQFLVVSFLCLTASLHSWTTNWWWSSTHDRRGEIRVLRWPYLDQFGISTFYVCDNFISTTTALFRIVNLNTRQGVSCSLLSVKISDSKLFTNNVYMIIYWFAW